MSRARFDNVLAAGVVACWLLMMTSYTLAETNWFRGAMAGMAGTYARWLTFAVFAPVTGAVWFAIGRLLYGTGRSSIWIPVACGSVLACALDLRRSRSAGPGRLVAWCVLVIGAAAGIVFAVAPPD